ncbi:MAG: PGRS family protein [Polyangiaceae bacterium]|nr:PGRS family protein [Polyangiaceae bacterium]
MRFQLFLSASLVFGTVGAAAGSAGCYNVGNDCNLFNCATGGGAGSTATAGTAGSGGTGASTPEGCVPKDATGPVADGCGIFVALSGNDANQGTKTNPLKTLKAAIEKAKADSKRVYACGETFNEPLVVDSNVTIFGALNCTSDWSYNASTRTLLTADPDNLPLRIAQGTSLSAEDFDIAAADAAAPGGSSIAIIAEQQATLTLARSEVVAGVGAAGSPGQSFGDFAADGMKGSIGTDACTAAQTVTAAPPINACTDVESVGGAGGNGLPASGGDGSSGSPLGMTNGGTGDTGTTACKPGSAGQTGLDGGSGAGAAGMGSINSTGYTGVPGENGTPGTTGQGGGGGGGSKGGSGINKCPDAAKSAGASGGSGGSGGCGGQGGNGGAAGGSSIAVLTLGAALIWNDVTITAKAGGTGGDGGSGQFGGLGGSGGSGGKIPMGAVMNPGCVGQSGGNGGNGGHGGGGMGGHSIAIAHTGAAPDMSGALLFVATAGEGGTGDGVNDSTKGAKGIAAEIQAF